MTQSTDPRSLTFGEWLKDFRANDQRLFGVVDLRAAWLAATSAAESKYRQWSLALQSLTPGGSEYVDDPERCVAFVREVRESQHITICSAMKRAKAAETEAAKYREELEQLRVRLDGETSQRRRAEEQRDKALARKASQ